MTLATEQFNSWLAQNSCDGECFSYFNLSSEILEQDFENIFCEGPDSKYFGSRGLSRNSWTPAWQLYCEHWNLNFTVIFNA